MVAPHYDLPDALGHFGPFGGVFVAETLMPALEELKANMEKSKKELEHALHNKNILEQRKKLVERKERSHRLIVKGAEFEKAFPLSRDLEQEEVQEEDEAEESTEEVETEEVADEPKIEEAPKVEVKAPIKNTRNGKRR